MGAIVANDSHVDAVCGALDRALTAIDAADGNVALGVKPNSQKQRVYVPSKSTICGR